MLFLTEVDRGGGYPRDGGDVGKVSYDTPKKQRLWVLPEIEVLLRWWKFRFIEIDPPSPQSYSYPVRRR